MRIWMLLVYGLLMIGGGGCQSAGPRGVPGGAVLAQSGGPVISFTAVNPGTVYLRDQTADRVIIEIQVNQGQRVEVDARANEVRVDDRPARAAPALNPQGVYQLFYKPAERREYHPMMNP
jgi:hypothetical protein